MRPGSKGPQTGTGLQPSGWGALHKKITCTKQNKNFLASVVVVWYCSGMVLVQWWCGFNEVVRCWSCGFDEVVQFCGGGVVVVWF